MTVEQRITRRWFALCAGLLLAVFVAVSASRYSPAAFGGLHDDSLYFSAAKSLAEGDGYRIASLPGEPPQTKYPILYPWLLSWVWRIDPQFPQNLQAAFWLNLAFGCGLVVAGMAALRRLGCGRLEALVLGVAFALHPYTVHWTGLLLSDVLFAAVALGAAVLTDDFCRRGGRWRAGAAIVLMTAAVLTRSQGAAFAWGLAAFALLRRRPGFATALAATAAPALLPLVSPVAVVSGPPGFVQNYLYYTSYAAFWKLSNPDWGAIADQIWVSAGELIKHPGAVVFLFPSGGFAPLGLRMLATVLTAAVVKGAVARARRSGWSAQHAAFLATVPVVLLWNYALLERFLLPFFPLYLAGAAEELRNLLTAVRTVWRDRRPLLERALAAGFAAAIAALAGTAAYRYAIDTPSFLAGEAARRQTLARAKAQAYEWLAANAPAGSRVVSYEDAALFLNIHLQGMRPASFSTEAFVRQRTDVLDRDLSRLGDTAQAIRARYWLVAADDFELEGAAPTMRRAVDRLLAGENPVFASADGYVRLYKLSFPADRPQ